MWAAHRLVGFYLEGEEGAIWSQGVTPISPQQTGAAEVSGQGADPGEQGKASQSSALLQLQVICLSWSSARSVL